MIENLSIFSIKPNSAQRKFSLRFLLLVFCFLSLSVEADERVNSNATADLPEVSGEIYITKGVTVFDSTNSSAYESIDIKDIAIVKEIESDEKSEKISEIIEKLDNSREKIAIVKKVKTNPHIIFTTFSALDLENRSQSTSRKDIGKLAISISNVNMFGNKSLALVVLPPFIGETEKLKNYHILSYLQFGKYRNAPLRAPPIEC
ncbi:hypothetical protein [Frigoriflavimonas asaccharolytica]|uniref:Uncharacterized protein n=1 Tax=Frigoriflavimonas asaccharolytica TaxID=2735899 RepID=A0A8J8GCT6_9FLAO|nr:hypothetical protein [Frigoriflavimonas asaccharolytica]NRS94152.1 hypothetical protein [Frigoriflavimonas asaccharolytica]